MSDNEKIAYCFTITPIVPDDADWTAAEPSEKVQFKHPKETYGKSDSWEVSNVKKLTEEN